MGESMEHTLREAERAAKKQRTCVTETGSGIAVMLKDIAAARAQVERAASAEAPAIILTDLVKQLKADGHSGVMADATKDLHNAVSKLGKAIERAFVPDICKATSMDLGFDLAALNEVVAEHLFQQGCFSVGELFLREAQLPQGDNLKAPFACMHSVLKSISVRDLEPALAWVEEHRAQLALASATSAHDFEFRLHRLRFVQLLTTRDDAAALQYIRHQAERFKGGQARELTKLMGCLAFSRRLACSPYAALLDDSQWDGAARDFARHCCGLLGLAYESPLLVAVAAGAVALPALLKLSGILSAQGQDITRVEQLPVELALGKDFVFHSIFACPVSKDQSTEENPPMLLPCGHVLCKVSVLKIAKSSSRSFKCPYCPAEATPAACWPIHFPQLTGQ